MLIVTGYGFVDFESNTCAEAAVKALQAKGIQAQMAKVGITQLRSPASVRLCMQVLYTVNTYIQHNTFIIETCQGFIKIICICSCVNIVFYVKISLLLF